MTLENIEKEVTFPSIPKNPSSQTTFYAFTDQNLT